MTQKTISKLTDLYEMCKAKKMKKESPHEESVELKLWDAT